MRNPFNLKNTIESEGLHLQDREAPIEFEESLMDEGSHGALERGGAAPRLRMVLILTISLVALLTARLYYLAVVRHEYFREIAEGNRLRVEFLPAPRGAVYDTNHETIAGNRPSFELVASPLDLPKDPHEYSKVVSRAAGILGVLPAEIDEIVKSKRTATFESALIKQNLTREQALIFHERIAGLPGFRVVDTPIRDYKNAEMYSHLLGYVGKVSGKEYDELKSSGYLFNDALGKTGLEAAYENYLRGKFGQRQVEVDARGVVKKVFGSKEALTGSNLVLNVDDGLQQRIYQSLKSRLQSLGRKKAAAIAMDPASGRILAFVSLPGYDNNLFAEGISQSDYEKLLTDKNRPLFNRAIGGTYPPGSTVKPMVAAAALQEQVITEATKIEDRGSIVVRNAFGGPDFYFYGYNRQGLGTMDVRRAIALSSDIFFYVAGGGYDQYKVSGLGIARLAEYYRAFGLDKKLGIDLPGEEAGLVPDPAWKKDRWFLGDTYHVSIGQGDLLATPLHVLSWVGAIANGGKIYQPFIVDRIENNDGEVIKKFEPKLLGRVPIDDKNLQIVREGMRAVVTEGTAKSLNTLPIAAAGKTGTAQFDARNPHRAHAWFAGYAPYDDPKIAIVVLIEDGGEGTVASAPVVKDALDWWARNRYNINQ